MICSRRILASFPLLTTTAIAFVAVAQSWVANSHGRQQHPHPIPTRKTHLFGIAEWRDTVFDDEVSSSSPPTEILSTDGLLAKEICILPFPFNEVQLQGETRQLRLYEDRFLQLFDDAMENHSGMVAMGFIMENEGLLQTVPLAEIEAFNRMEGFGIFLTVRVVGRARLVDVVKTAPYIKAKCREIVDDISPYYEK